MNLADFGRTWLNLAELGQSCSKFGQIWPILAESGQLLTQIRPSSTMFDQTRPNSGQSSPGVGQVWVDVGLCAPAAPSAYGFICLDSDALNALCCDWPGVFKSAASGDRSMAMGCSMSERALPKALELRTGLDRPGAFAKNVCPGRLTARNAHRSQGAGIAECLGMRGRQKVMPQVGFFECCLRLCGAMAARDRAPPPALPRCACAGGVRRWARQGCAMSVVVARSGAQRRRGCPRPA